MHKLLRLVLLTDGVILALLGATLLLAPAWMLAAFGYTEVPRSVNFVASMWGAALLSVALMHFYLAARRADLRDWAGLGFVRNLLEFAVTLAFVINGVVNLRQSWPGLFFPIWFAIFYYLVIMLGRRERSMGPPPATTGVRNVG